MIYHAISLHQPYASLLAYRIKTHETRHWPAPARVIGKAVAIHAAKKPIPREIDPDLEKLCVRFLGLAWREAMPLGAFVAHGILASSKLMVEDELGFKDRADLIAGYWEPGRWRWRFAEVARFNTPIPAIGRQSWWYAEIEETAA